ncbi:hypothetical protein [Roseobacter weihaiensis]|uniref:hypothetical protein n=1 Tax=Roseobacter weihaiensis TaxID=2763262 RepID=UPI001D0AF880|nr:hypothetical protein [Roseobacter sp. H9]
MNFILNKTAASLCAAISFASSVLAQDLPTPTIDAETRGFSIGMTSDQVLEQIQSEFPNSRPRITNTRRQNSRQEFIYSIQVIADGEKLWFYFTGHFSGNRLFSLKREAKFKAGNRPSAFDTRQQLLAKYGLPTQAGGHTLFYKYDANDVVLLGTDDEIRSLINVDKWE